MMTTKDEPSICSLNLIAQSVTTDRSCPNDWPMNEDGNCHPGDNCPDGFGRVDDDEIGTCYVYDIVDARCKVLDDDDCAIYDPNPPQIQGKCVTLNQTTCCNPDENVNVLKAWALRRWAMRSERLPDGYKRLDDDETGRCYAEAATKVCPPDNIRVLQSEACPEVPEAEEASNDNMIRGRRTRTYNM